MCNALESQQYNNFRNGETLLIFFFKVGSKLILFITPFSEHQFKKYLFYERTPNCTSGIPSRICGNLDLVRGDMKGHYSGYRIIL